MKRKSVTYLNQLKHDVEGALDGILKAGEAVESATFELSKVLACDLRTDDANIKRMYGAVTAEQDNLGKQLKSFIKARENYLDFF